MKEATAINRYRETQTKNLDAVRALVDGKLAEQYPKLTEFAQGRGAVMFDGLEYLLAYFIEYGTKNESKYPYRFESRQKVEYRPDVARGGRKVVEMFCSYGYMTENFGNYTEKTWKGIVARAAVLDLLRVFKPSQRPEEAGEEQLWSIARAKSLRGERNGKSRPVNYYSVPRYLGTGGAFERAEKRVWIVKQLGPEGCRDKDLVRRALARKLGSSRAARHADLIFCNSYERHAWRDEKETILCAALVMELRRSGFAYPETVVYYAEHGQDKYSRGALRRIWETHRAVILERCGVFSRRPTKADKAPWGLIGDKHILTARGDLPVFDVELKEPEEESFPF